MTREAAGSTNLSRTTYAQSYSTGDHYSQQIRTEETGSGASWINSSRTTYQYDGMNRQDYEMREDYVSDPDPDWVQTYLIEQEYDKKGNRTRLDRNVPIDYKDDYGLSMDLGYTYNTVNALTAITDADDGNYECTVTCDANNNITLVAESVSTGGYSANLTTLFSYDWANRLETSTVSRYSSADKDMVYTKREHEYDAAGRLVNSTYKNWLGGEEEPTGDTVEHCYAKSKHIQNTDGSSNYGAVWHWAGVNVPESPVLRSPNADTASQVGYNQTDYVAPQRRTYLSPTSAGDERNLYGQGKPMAKDSSGGGLDWSTGIESESPDSVTVTLESRLDFDGTVAPTDLSRATDAREKGRIGIFGSQLSYAGSSGRVTSEPLGRDLNPLGRGDGGAYVAGAVNLGVIAPRLPGSRATGGTGNSVNNCGQCGGGGGGKIPLHQPREDEGYELLIPFTDIDAHVSIIESLFRKLPFGAIAWYSGFHLMGRQYPTWPPVDDWGFPKKLPPKTVVGHDEWDGECYTTWRNRYEAGLLSVCVTVVGLNCAVADCDPCDQAEWALDPSDCTRRHCDCVRYECAVYADNYCGTAYTEFEGNLNCCPWRCVECDRDDFDCCDAPEMEPVLYGLKHCVSGLSDNCYAACGAYTSYMLQWACMLACASMMEHYRQKICCPKYLPQANRICNGVTSKAKKCLGC